MLRVLLVFLCVASLRAQDGTTPPLDVFLLIGQSNMAGRATVEPADRQPLPGIWALNRDLRWQPAVDPLHWDKPDQAGTGLARSFAQELLAARPGLIIGFVPAAMGGSSLDEWQPGSLLFNQAVARTRAALAHGGVLRGILWHQGETDSAKKELAQTYAARWLVMIAALRRELHAPDVPVIVGEPGAFVSLQRQANGRPGFPFVPLVSQQLVLLASLSPHTAFVSSEDLTDRGDRLHFDHRSIEELGRRYARAFLRLDTPAPSPAL